MTGDPPVIISVTGAHSGAGKTSLCSLLLSELRGFGAIKFTKTELYTSVAESSCLLDQKGKDTALMIHAGAEKVVWVQSPVSGLRGALEIALQKFSGARGVIIEGNSPVDFLNPHLVIFIMGPDGTIKPSARKIIGKADIIVINSRDRAGSKAFHSPLSGSRGRLFRFNPEEKGDEAGEFLTYVRSWIVSGHVQEYRDSPGG